ncbi:hypothetical protein H8958_006659 [Nasalis larvatus]
MADKDPLPWEVLPGILQKHCCILPDRNTDKDAQAQGIRSLAENSELTRGSPGFLPGCSDLRPFGLSPCSKTLLHRRDSSSCFSMNISRTSSGVYDLIYS